jgi:tRNA dimethylallyltransferase
MADDALVITGATAVGKTAVAIAVAERVRGAVISMDSRQVYRGMDVGTAKPSLEDRRGVPHYGFDVVDPGTRYSAGAFARDARKWIADARAGGLTPILAGGTGFFLRALTHPLFREAELPDEQREALKRWLAGRGTEQLRFWAGTLDAEAGEMLRGGRQRLARLIEVALLTGRPLSWWLAHAPPAHEPLRPLTVVLELPRSELYRRIDDRVFRMVENGLIDEVRALAARGFTAGDPGMNATGYIELLPLIAGERSLEEAIALTQAATRRYARRQLTWLRHQLPPGAHRLDASRPVDELADTITRLWRKEAAF